MFTKRPTMFKYTQISEHWDHELFKQVWSDCCITLAIDLPIFSLVAAAQSRIRPWVCVSIVSLSTRRLRKTSIDCETIWERRMSSIDVLLATSAYAVAEDDHTISGPVLVVWSSMVQNVISSCRTFCHRTLWTLTPRPNSCHVSTRLTLLLGCMLALMTLRCTIQRNLAGFCLHNFRPSVLPCFGSD